MGELTNNVGAGEIDRASVPPIGTGNVSSGFARQTKEAATEVAVHAKGLASDVAHQTMEKVDARVAAQKGKSARDVSDVAKALRETSGQLDGNMLFPYIEKAAEKLETASQFLRTANLKDLRGTLETFARREPALFLGGALALGALAARFLKSSSAAEATDRSNAHAFAASIP